VYKRSLGDQRSTSTNMVSTPVLDQDNLVLSQKIPNGFFWHTADKFAPQLEYWNDGFGEVFGRVPSIFASPV